MFEQIQTLACTYGFPLSGIASIPPTGEAPDAKRFSKWLAAGHAGPLDYVTEQAATRQNLNSRYPWAKSILCLGAFYDGSESGTPGKDLVAHVARYARGRDYHKIFEKRLKRLQDALLAEKLCSRARYYVDTGPILERSWSQKAGLGWTGKNTCLIHPRLGSFFLLAELLLDTDCPPTPSATNHCGTCTRCLEACPTGALVEPGVLDARKCISTWTLEQKGQVDAELWPQHAGWAAGCDICQSVCPYNSPGRMAEPDPELAEPLPWAKLTLAEAMVLTQESFDQNFPASALRRTGWKGIRLGAITAAGSLLKAPAAEVIVELQSALRRCAQDADMDIQDRAYWALQRLSNLV